MASSRNRRAFTAYSQRGWAPPPMAEDVGHGTLDAGAKPIDLDCLSDVGFQNTTGAGIASTLEDTLAEIRRLMLNPGIASPHASPTDQDVRIEIARMVRSIAKAKTELALLRDPRQGDDQVLRARNELDEIVDATETATNTILSSAEEVERLLNQIRDDSHDPSVFEACENGLEAITRVFEACNFQDITGQRVTKVIRALSFIEARIVALIEIWGADAFLELPLPPLDDKDALLSGPQASGQGISQDEIDKLFD